MKLFLSSVSIARQNQQAFIDLVGKEAKSIRVALIENGADTYSDDHREWVTRAREMIHATVGEVVTFDLRAYIGRNDLENDLSQYDVVWMGGGNVYYLRWLSREAGFDGIIKQLAARGIVYGGDSAGAIIAGPTVNYFQSADEPGEAPKLILEGFGLTDTVVVPHYDHIRYSPIMKNIEEKLVAAKYNITVLTDTQAFIVDGDIKLVVGQ